MAYKISIDTPCSDVKAPHIGGKALIGGMHSWPTTPEGTPLTLIMSIPTNFLNKYLEFSLPEGKFVSVFSYYSKEEYFLDYICYHGNPKELELIKKGYTQTLLHSEGTEVSDGATIPQMLINVADDNQKFDAYQGSKIGGNAGFLQNEQISFTNLGFALQLYGGDFPEPFRDVFFLSDAIGYLYLPCLPGASNEVTGQFFAQAT